MGSDSSKPDDIFDLAHIRRLVALMDDHELSEVDLRQGGVRIRLRKGSGEVATVVAPAAAPTPATAAPTPAPATAPSAEQAVTIKSPMVGTFYTASSPDSPPFVKVGDHVSEDTVVCIVEAMKVFNEIPAEMSGKIVSRLVQDGDPVEFGQPLFKIETGA